MTIHFYLNDKTETPITSFHDLATNPFKVGDIINLSVDELYPKDYSQYNKPTQEKMILDNDKLRNNFNIKSIKIVREGKYCGFNGLTEPILTIEYHCEIVD